MKKFLIILSLSLFALTASVMATETRVKTMGDNNMILLDEANIYLFPSRLNDWPNLAVGEFGSGDFSKFGLHWKFGGEEKTWYMATYFNNNSTELPEFYDSPFFDDFGYGAASTYIPFDNAILPNKRMDLFYGRTLGKNLFGFHFGMVQSSMRNNGGFTIDAKDDESLGIYKFAFGLTMNEGLLDISAGIDFISFKDRDTDINGTAYDQTKSEGNTRLHFDIRSFYNHDDNYTFIPHLSIVKGSYEADYFDYDIAADSLSLDQNNKYSTILIDLGVGIEYQPANNVLAVLDIGFTYDKVDGDFTPASGGTSEASMKTVTFPYFKLGFDADVFKWMDIRFGTTSYWRNESIENTTANSEVISRFPDNKTYLGFGFHWNRLHIDTHTDPQLFLRGFDFINGADNGSDMNFRISIVYEMM